ncbi:hypothetical protein F5Y19DRAFT_308228 [Xylariaceae sp. FL1651]|nr:hypothetical protein F5Y19DRAFT_308228 [Xylariaceae sp. FL1651]
MAQQGGVYSVSTRAGARTLRPQNSTYENSCDDRCKIDGQQPATEKSGEDNSVSAGNCSPFVHLSRSSAALKAEGTVAVARSKSPSQGPGRDIDESDALEWVAVTNHEERDIGDRTDSGGWTWSTAFDATFGCGRWKFTLFKFQMNIEKYDRVHASP